MQPLEQRGRAEACVWTCSVVRSLQVQLPRAAACIRHHLAPRRYRHPGRCVCDTPQTPWDVDFPCAPGTYACWAGTVRGRGLRNVGETFGCASSGTCPGRRALRSHASPATTPPHRPPAHPDRPTWSACMPCVDGDRREASRLSVSPEPALPAGAPEHIFVRCLCAEPSRASLERWQHAFGRWTPATSHLSGPAHAVHAVAATRQTQVHSVASPGALQTCVMRLPTCPVQPPAASTPARTEPPAFGTPLGDRRRLVPALHPPSARQSTDPLTAPEALRRKLGGANTPSRPMTDCDSAVPRMSKGAICDIN